MYVQRAIQRAKRLAQPGHLPATGQQGHAGGLCRTRHCTAIVTRLLMVWVMCATVLQRVTLRVTVVGIPWCSGASTRLIIDVPIVHGTAPGLVASRG